MKKLAILLLMFFCLPCLGATYYVDATDGNDANTGDITHPWKTMARAQLGSADDPNVVGGDTVYIADGNYGLWKWSTVNNTSGQWITYAAADTNNPPVFAKIYLNESSQTLYDAYLIFDGLHFEMSGVEQAELLSPRSFACWNLSYIKITNCRFEAGLNWRTLDHTIVGACAYLRGKPGGPPAAQIELSDCVMTNSQDGIAAYMLSDSLFENNNIYGLGNDAIVASDISDTVISGNYIHDMGVVGNGFSVDGNSTLADGPFQIGETISQTNPTYDTVTAVLKVINDEYYFYEVGDVTIPVGGFLAGYEISGVTSGATFTPSSVAANNEVYHSDDLQIYSTAALEGQGTIDNITIRKNIFSSGNQGLLWEGTTTNDGLLVENNLWYGKFNQAVCSIIGKTHSVTIRNNTYAQDADNIISDTILHSTAPGSVYEIHNNLYCRYFSVTYGGNTSGCTLSSDSGYTVTKTNGFNNYVYAEGDQLHVNSGTNATVGYYTITGKTSNSELALATSPNTGVCSDAYVTYGWMTLDVNESYNIMSDYGFTGIDPLVISETDHVYHKGTYPLTAGEMAALFTDYENDDYTLKSDACAVDFGSAVYAAETDILGVNRGANPDVGAYEYVTGGSSKATTPDPADDETDVSRTNDLGWVNGGGAENYNVYFGTNTPPTNIVNGTNQDATAYDTGTMEYETVYYWRIDANDANGITTGDAWNFTTLSDPADSVIHYFIGRQ